MHSIDLSPPEFWFYRVYSELTLSMLHQINNELTGVVFLSELIRDDLASGAPVGDKPDNLSASVENVLRLTKQMMHVHLPVPLEMDESPRDLCELMQEGIPMLRLVLPKAIAVIMEPPPACFPRVSVTPKEFHLVLAAVGMLLSPCSARSIGKLIITAEPGPPALVFYPDYPADEWTEEADSRLESSAAFLALNHRLKRLGGSAGVCRNPDEARRGGLRLLFATETL